MLTGDQARELEPELSPEIGKAVLFPKNRTLRDPHALVTALADRFTVMGGQIEHAQVEGFDHDQRINALKLADGRRLPVDEMVLCAGAYTARLSKLLAEPMPLETERGYSTQIMAPGIELRHSLIWPARAFMVSPTAGGIRVGGTVEMGLSAARLPARQDHRQACADGTSAARRSGNRMDGPPARVARYGASHLGVGADQGCLLRHRSRPSRGDTGGDHGAAYGGSGHGRDPAHRHDTLSYRPFLSRRSTWLTKHV